MPKLLEIVPEEYRAKEYLKPLLDLEQGPDGFKEIFKKMDGLESVLGKRPAIPDMKTAKPEDLDKFFSQFAPEKPEDYEIPVEKDAKIDEGFVKAVRGAFLAGKISKVQAQGFLKAINEYGVEARKNAAAAQAKKNAEFDTLAKTMLGEQNKAVMERVRKTIKELAPSVAQANLDKIDDTNLVVMAAVIDAIQKKYVPEDELNGKGKAGGGNGGNGTGGPKEKREEAKKLMTTKAYKDWQDPEHEATVAKVNALYKEIAAASA